MRTKTGLTALGLIAGYFQRQQLLKQHWPGVLEVQTGLFRKSRDQVESHPDGFA
jgi:hypothetical protein